MSQGICDPVRSFSSVPGHDFTSFLNLRRPDTGDRPYKCQHCGDAFARSDLLSRHVNKCHSAEKAAAIAAAEAAGIPLKSKKGKGSKSSCDQCIIDKSVCNSGEPCGLSNFFRYFFVAGDSF